MNLTNKEVDAALTDVRKAHRLLYQYQKRVLDIVYYIREKYDMPEFVGAKRFSNPIGKTRRCKDEYENVNLNVFRDMWAWDFLYSFEFEYYLGCKNTDSRQISISVLQISDSGFYESDILNKSKTNISSFKDIESSSSCLILVCETVNVIKKKVKEYWWKIDEAVESIFAGQEIYERATNDDNYFIAIKYNLSSFSDQSSADRIIKNFSTYVENKTHIKLMNK